MFQYFGIRPGVKLESSPTLTGKFNGGAIETGDASEGAGVAVTAKLTDGTVSVDAGVAEHV